MATTTRKPGGASAARKRGTGTRTATAPARRKAARPAAAAPGWSLVYIADPMCPWSHAFRPAIEAVQAHWPGLSVHPLVGGLREDDEALTTDAGAQLRRQWQAVAERSDTALDDTALLREGFVYNTEPACRAVVLMRAHTPPLGLQMLAALQDAFFRDGRDTTDPAVLADVAATLGVDSQDFLRAFHAPAAAETTRAEIAAVQQADIRGLPVLLAQREGGAAQAPVVEGWLPAAQVIVRLRERFGGG